MASKSGGGITSRNIVRPPSRQGMPARGINPGHVAQHGLALGNHATDAGNKKLSPAQPKFTQSPHSVPLGNEVAKNVGGGGPGAGRVVMGCGTQGQHGPVAPGNPPKAGELFPGWPASGGKQS
jgi:hypothetical protein